MYFSLDLEEVFHRLKSSASGLDNPEAGRRLAEHGPNRLPEAAMPGIWIVFARQFASPFIYILLGAAALSLVLREWSDAIFIAVVVILNAVIGTLQERRAEHSARALRRMVTTRTRVVRGGEVVEIDSEGLVPGDVVQLAPGDKVPADVRLIDTLDLRIDESLLTGESLPVAKDFSLVLSEDTGLGDRKNMAWAGTLVMRGKGDAMVVETGTSTQIGSLATELGALGESDTPLVIRMRHFTQRIAVIIVLVAAVFVAVEAARGKPVSEVALVAIALAVATIPEGLPVAITVSLAIAMRRMARRRVIVRRMASVEALGSCTMIASDKTGTLTVNKLTATSIVLAGGDRLEVTGVGNEPVGELRPLGGGDDGVQRERALGLIRTGALCNDGILVRDGDTWAQVGDTLDVSLLVLAHKIGMTRPQLLAEAPVLSEIPFESERRFAASLHADGDQTGEIHVKGALETVLAMCTHQAGPRELEELDVGDAIEEFERMADGGYRVIALANKRVLLGSERPQLHERDLCEMVYLGLVGMIDPPRETAAPAVAACAQAGLKVVMVTGDHPATAFSIAKSIGIATDRAEVVTGAQLRQASEDDGDPLAAIDNLVGAATVFARVEPTQKLDIVESFIRQGELVAVTGDGANDASALRRAHVGVAMGRDGTDVAREAADLIITDDDFSSIVGGIEEGRVAYGNVRKVISLLVSTGAGELVLFLLALTTGMQAPLTALQLLWLNLVTNGVQDVALAFESQEGNELDFPPRPPSEGVFDKLMVERIAVVALVMGAVAFGTYATLLNMGWPLFEARNATMASMVLMESVMVFCSRSETRSAFKVGKSFNRLLIWSTLFALGIHIAAMHFSPTQNLLDIAPLPLTTWVWLALASLILLASVEVGKASWRARHRMYFPRHRPQVSSG